MVENLPERGTNVLIPPPLKFLAELLIFFTGWGEHHFRLMFVQKIDDRTGPLYRFFDCDQLSD